MQVNKSHSKPTLNGAKVKQNIIVAQVANERSIYFL